MNAISNAAAEIGGLPAAGSHPPHPHAPAAGAGLPLGAVPFDAAQPAGCVTLRRTGRKPLRFSGWLLVEAASPAEAGTLYHELRLYRSRHGQIVIELVTRREGMQAADIERAETLPDLAEAAAWLEAHDCAADLPVPATITDREKPLSQAVLQAVALRQHQARVQDEFACLISDVFAALDLAELLEPPEPV